MKSDVLQRVTLIISTYNLSKKAFSDKIGMEQTTVNNQIIGKRGISIDLILNTLKSFPDLSAEWLMRGEGPMLRPDPSQSVGDISGSTVVGNNVHGSGNNITSHAELAALQGQYLEMLKKRDEQIDRLTAVIERLTAKL